MTDEEALTVLRSPRCKGQENGRNYENEGRGVQYDFGRHQVVFVSPNELVGKMSPDAM